MAWRTVPGRGVPLSRQERLVAQQAPPVYGHSGSERRRSAWLWFALALLVYTASPIRTSFDSRWSVFVALSVLQEGNFNLDEYTPRLRENDWYLVECVPVPPPGTVGCGTGHSYNYFPPATPLLAVPVVALSKALTGPWTAALPVQHPLVAAYLRGDLVTGFAVAEGLTAALITAAAVAVLWLVLRRLLPSGPAHLLTGAFAFASPAWSTASRALWMHGPTMLCLALAIWLLLRDREGQSGLPVLGLVAAFAFAVRPSNAVVVLTLTAYVAVHRRERLVRYLLWASPVAVLFFAHNLLTRGTVWTNYYLGRGSSLLALPFGEGVALELASPSRGLFVFSPWLLVSLAGIALAVRRRWLWPVTPFLLALLALHLCVIGTAWPGHCYGPRYLSDVVPLLVLFLVPVYRWWEQAQPLPRHAALVLFLIAISLGGLIHARGALSDAVYLWNTKPVNVDTHPARVWDWQDPQFLR